VGIKCSRRELFINKYKDMFFFNTEFPPKFLVFLSKLDSFYGNRPSKPPDEHTQPLPACFWRLNKSSVKPCRPTPSRIVGSYGLGVTLCFIFPLPITTASSSWRP